jgi:hypothetical protein
MSFSPVSRPPLQELSWSYDAFASRVATTYSDLLEATDIPSAYSILQAALQRLTDDPEYASVWYGECERIAHVVLPRLEGRPVEATPYWDRLMKMAKIS